MLFWWWIKSILKSHISQDTNYAIDGYWKANASFDKDKLQVVLMYHDALICYFDIHNL